jgi:hypothetical protein
VRGDRGCKREVSIRKIIIVAVVLCESREAPRKSRIVRDLLRIGREVLQQDEVFRSHRENYALKLTANHALFAGSFCINHRLCPKQVGNILFPSWLCFQEYCHNLFAPLVCNSAARGRRPLDTVSRWNTLSGLTVVA